MRENRGGDGAQRGTIEKGGTASKESIERAERREGKREAEGKEKVKEKWAK